MSETLRRPKAKHDRVWVKPDPAVKKRLGSKTSQNSDCLNLQVQLGTQIYFKIFFWSLKNILFLASVRRL